MTAAKPQVQEAKAQTVALARYLVTQREEWLEVRRTAEGEEGKKIRKEDEGKRNSTRRRLRSKGSMSSARAGKGQN